MKTRTNHKAKYYTPPGSYNGLVKIDGHWYRVMELNRINKTGWIRWQGPPSAAMRRALKCSFAWLSTILYPERKR